MPYSLTPNQWQSATVGRAHLKVPPVGLTGAIPSGYPQWLTGFIKNRILVRFMSTKSLPLFIWIVPALLVPTLFTLYTNYHPEFTKLIHADSTIPLIFVSLHSQYHLFLFRFSVSFLTPIHLRLLYMTLS